ncbi:MAG: hypothetical protein KF760_25740 [Candidatus Eremiobacteraeota bacterium]|nr:hypothetical protein [Candidatus Eremiobacteraeota bacterium]MCW5872377.1 hypothetical protein [Candidatus Eremiobacteraeota bacterium]
MEIGPVQRMQQLTPLRRPTKMEESGPADTLVPVLPVSTDLPASKTSPRIGPPQAALVAISLIGALGSMASLFMGAAPANAEPMAQVQIQAHPQQNPIADLTTQVVVHARHGQVLRQDHMIKMDTYPGMHKATLQQGQNPQPLLDGAPNFRQLPGSNVYGVGQPTVQGLRSVLNDLNAGPNGTGPAVTWTTLREEPTIYIQGRSYTPRSLEHPTTNLADPGVSAATVESREDTLKQEILQEAAQHGGRFLVAEENPDGSVVGKWVELKPGDVQTPAEVFQDLRAQGYKVDYARIPVSDEKAPENQDFDALVARLRTADPNSPLVFNCHAGRGRTTTGMVIGQLFRGVQNPAPGGAPQGADRFEQGNFKAVLALIGQLQGGPESKAALDAVIDQSGEVQNLRTAIAKLKVKSETSPQRAVAEESLSAGKDYLYRYYKLIAFENYLREMAPQGFPQDFSSWIRQHPELDISPESLELAFNYLAGNNAAQLA